MKPGGDNAGAVRRVLEASNHYAVLGVDIGASAAEVERAHKKLMVALHPDQMVTSDFTLQITLIRAPRPSHSCRGSTP